jgi:hypothetical protein
VPWSLRKIGPLVCSPMYSSAVRRMHRCERLGRGLASLARDPQHAVPALVAQILDVVGEDLADPQPFVGEQADERRRPRPVLLCRAQQAVELVDGQPDGR